VRIAIARPLFIEAVPVEDHLYVDGGGATFFDLPSTAPTGQG
jgi:hypothetical protein